ncbi:MAG TPA: immunoglobulin domain-containing protein [Candidatus Hydrogenedentes bacterium]|nr:immunoglobulin domain-containing protein [Candidatus Hydrogenedentota bacterium]
MRNATQGLGWLITLGLCCFTPLFGATEETYSQVQFPASISEEDLEVITGEPIDLVPREDGQKVALLRDETVRILKAYGVELEVLSTKTQVAPPSFEKGTFTITKTNATGFAINFANTQSIVINDAPADAVVISVTVRVKGIAAYADLCDFALRSSWGSPNIVQYNFPKWYDEIWFDHTVSNIPVFAGQPVNQTWTLYGKGSNTAGERVEQWWLTITYSASGSGGGGGGELSDYYDLSCQQSNVDHHYEKTGTTQTSFYPYKVGNLYYVQGKVPLQLWVQIPTIPYMLGPLCVTIDHYTRTVTFRYGPPQSMTTFLPAVVFPTVDTLIFTVGSLSPGTWRFKTDYNTMTCWDMMQSRTVPCDPRPTFDQYVTIPTDSPPGPPQATPEPRVAITASPRVEEGQRVILETTLFNVDGPVSYQWYKNGVPIPGAVDSKLVFNPVLRSDTGVYRVEVTTLSKTRITQDFSLRVYEVNTLPAISYLLVLLVFSIVVYVGIRRLFVV